MGGRRCMVFLHPVWCCFAHDVSVILSSESQKQSLQLYQRTMDDVASYLIFLFLFFSLSGFCASCCMTRRTYSSVLSFLNNHRLFIFFQTHSGVIITWWMVCILSNHDSAANKTVLWLLKEKKIFAVAFISILQLDWSNMTQMNSNFYLYLNAKRNESEIWMQCHEGEVWDTVTSMDRGINSMKTFYDSTLTPSGHEWAMHIHSHRHGLRWCALWWSYFNIATMYSCMRVSSTLGSHPRSDT